jgi:hypothetical protein
VTPKRCPDLPPHAGEPEFLLVTGSETADVVLLTMVAVGWHTGRSSRELSTTPSRDARNIARARPAGAIIDMIG